jgi:hypothetical protein
MSRRAWPPARRGQVRQMSHQQGFSPGCRTGPPSAVCDLPRPARGLGAPATGVRQLSCGQGGPAGKAGAARACAARLPQLPPPARKPGGRHQGLQGLSCHPAAAHEHGRPGASPALRFLPSPAPVLGHRGCRYLLQLSRLHGRAPRIPLRPVRKLPPGARRAGGFGHSLFQVSCTRGFARNRARRPPRAVQILSSATSRGDHGQSTVRVVPSQTAERGRFLAGQLPTRGTLRRLPSPARPSGPARVRELPQSARYCGRGREAQVLAVSSSTPGPGHLRGRMVESLPELPRGSGCRRPGQFRPQAPDVQQLPPAARIQAPDLHILSRRHPAIRSPQCSPARELQSLPWFALGQQTHAQGVPGLPPGSPEPPAQRAALLCLPLVQVDQRATHRSVRSWGISTYELD